MFLVCSFICVVFLCPFTFFFCLTYCVWGLPFPGFKVEFFLLFCFCSLKISPVVCVRVYRVRFLLSICLFLCLFFLWLAKLSEVIILSADDWVFLFCLLFKWSVLYRVILVVGWCLVSYSSGFLCVSYHYLILPGEQTHLQGAVAEQVLEVREELLHIQGQEGEPLGDTLHPR